MVICGVCVFSLGVEPVDPDVMARPPRKAKDPMISFPFLLQTFVTAMIIVAGTLYVFWKEVSGWGFRECEYDKV